LFCQAATKHGIYFIVIQSDTQLRGRVSVGLPALMSSEVAMNRNKIVHCARTAFIEAPQKSACRMESTTQILDHCTSKRDPKNDKQRFTTGLSERRENNCRPVRDSSHGGGNDSDARCGGVPGKHQIEPGKQLGAVRSQSASHMLPASLPASSTLSLSGVARSSS
jgi:hypothetical protein